MDEQYRFAGIYQILNLKNGKRYIGQSQNIAQRRYDHKRKLNVQTRLARAIKKDGWDSFEFSVIEVVDDLSLLDQREQYWMDVFDACNEKKGYNICAEAGTTRGWTHSEEVRQRLSVSASQRINSANPFYGRHHTDETKTKISVAKTGKSLTQGHREKIRQSWAGGKKPLKIAQVNPETGDVVRIWHSVSEASKTLGINQPSITLCCRGKRKSAGGYMWKISE